MTAGGRGRNAPAMTHEDAAALLCAVLGSENVKDSTKTVASMRNLEGNFHGRTKRDFWNFDTGIRPGHNAVEALAQVLRCFDRENEIIRHIKRDEASIDDDEFEQTFYGDYGSREAEFYVLFEVQYPKHYASITVGVHKGFKETWTYGRRGRPRNEQVRRIREIALKEIAQALRPEILDATA